MVIYEEPLVSKQLLPLDQLLHSDECKKLPDSIYGGIKIRASTTALELGIGIAYLVNFYAVKVT